MMAAGKFASFHRNVQTNHQFPLASSMDLLSSKSPLAERRSNSFQDVCIHGTLPRKKKEKTPIRSCDMFSHMGTLPHTKSHRLPSPFMQDIIEEYPFQERRAGVHTSREYNVVDPAMEYVKFSRDRYIMDGGTPEKLKKELEEELKLSSEELRSHAWYHGRIPRQVSESLVRRDGDFLIRDSLSSPGNLVLTCQWKNVSQHFKINKVVVRLKEAYCRIQYQFEHESFDSVPALVRYYVGNRKPVSQQSGAIIFQPINRTVPLRCIEEKYGVSPVRHLESGVLDGRVETPKRLSLNIGHGLSQEHVTMRGNLLRNKEKSGSQPACLDNMREKRRPLLKAHQSESYLPIGVRQQYPSSTLDAKLSPRPHVFRTGSEPTLSPTEIRRFANEAHSAEALRGSDSQLCSRPPPKPSKALNMMYPPSPTVWQNSEANYCELHPNPPEDSGWTKTLSSHNSFSEGRRTDEDEELSLSNSDMSFHLMEDSLSQCSVADLGDNVQDDVFIRPVYETVSSFNFKDYESVLLTPENKPLETNLLRRAKELFTNNDPRTIAKHILRMDCKVARILDVAPEVMQNMGVSSGLELVILPYGHQLRMDLIERHGTMAIGLAVDILGCTGNLEERVATLNKIIQLAVELKDLGDLFAFSAIMKALDMQQITRLEQTWTLLRHQYTQTAITYEKQLKPFLKSLHEGGVFGMQDSLTVPLVMPLVTLLERQAVVFEGLDMWENNDRSCEIMFSHLETARFIAQNAAVYQKNAERALEGFTPDDEMSEVFKTEFQMRLLWGSKGVQVNQTERYQKFSQILTALSRKLESPS
ncbi:breast cancer anti-estrogen resistance protein 3 isoform X2 [Bombina bombina]|uniref:breast cancer anti-estrogen resistance protein 3 isoform X2 n=1 Tax=Bombina bombina TaxID=8345 RepID=UPI00235B0BF4|nr:breast cancer anti-estrogen resistance protein 3 isoform X2 [Bombina bombina]